jgi:cellulase
MAAVSDAVSAVGLTASWFKVAEMGLPSNNPEYWGTQVFKLRFYGLAV